MTDTPKKPQLNEEQVDQLLTAFYQSEVPERLDVPPSAWSQLQSDSGPAVKATSSPSTTTPPSSGRGIVVAIASLAACLTILAVSDFGPTTTENGNPVASETEDPTGIPNTEELMNVSENPDQGADDTLNDNGLKLEELEAIRLEETPSEDAEKTANEKKENEKKENASEVK